jgi:transcriptional regulator with XRE-family HTH domain
MAGATNIELKEFLTARRARLTPDQVGIEPWGVQRRRVPGLRREEVAQLAGVSVDYYVRLERGQARRISRQVLDALARALQLDETEHDHLIRIASADRPPTSPGPRPSVPHPGLQSVLDSIDGVPAILLGPRMEVLASNPLARAFYWDFDEGPEERRSMPRFMFLDPAAREFYVDWKSAARGLVGTLHHYAGRHPQDTKLAKLVGELSLRDPDFRRWWAEHDVFIRTFGTKEYRHRVVGSLTLGYHSLSVDDGSEQRLGVHTVEPGSPSATGLQLLASWGASNPQLEHSEPSRATKLNPRSS